jgi:hypothetical protein
LLIIIELFYQCILNSTTENAIYWFYHVSNIQIFKIIIKMKNIKVLVAQFCVIAISSIVIGGCSGADDGSQTARVMVRMTDAPGDYDEVNVDVQMF